MYDDVLFPTDGSGDANRALEHALELAEGFGATLHVVFVTTVTDAEASESDGESRVREQQKGRGESALVAIDDAATEYGLDVTTAIREGDPREELLAYAEAASVDVIVMGTHGQDGDERDRQLLGGVTDYVVRTSDVPVMTVSP
ncbi:universal stress protein [Natronomonas amylolytica]|uniref:universal stress protein n=1 Tax=Natronomonas amylolytica TaxID=3108498 RepID=UPI0030087838